MDNIFLVKANIFQVKLAKDNTLLAKDYMALEELPQDKAKDNILLKNLMLLNMQVLMSSKEVLVVALDIILMIEQIFLDQKFTNLNKKMES
jgi:hypothetical protein